MATSCDVCSGTGLYMFWKCASCAGQGKLYKRLRLIEGEGDPLPKDRESAIRRAYNQQRARLARKGFRVIAGG